MSKPINNAALLTKAAESPYCSKNHVQFKSVKTIWDRMSSFISNTLKAHKVLPWTPFP